MARGEFNPTSEKHFVAFIVKAVDPGCTLEYQIEERDGTVTRLTTTEDPEADRKAFLEAVQKAAERSLRYSFYPHR